MQTLIFMVNMISCGIFIALSYSYVWDALVVTGLLTAWRMLYLIWLDEKTTGAQLLQNRKQMRLHNGRVEALLHDKYILLREKELLLNKVHHRVKNNLQVIISLLSAQTEYVLHPIVSDALKESQLSLEVMLFAQKRFYGEQGINLIDMRAFLDELTDLFSESYLNDGLEISFFSEVMPVRLDMSHAGVIGLIINEVVGSAVKYDYATLGNLRFYIKLTAENSYGLKMSISYYGRSAGLAPAIKITEMDCRFNVLSELCAKLGAEARIEGDRAKEICVVIRQPFGEFIPIQSDLQL
jgi:two-component sensor histidine kinase